MKLYKFRPLANCQDLMRAQEILETGKFWCSRFWELNDPLEGLYWFNAGTLNDQFMSQLYKAKSSHGICSFSGSEAFKSPLMWGYYANGFKGIAIEIEAEIETETNGEGHNIYPVSYVNNVAGITNNIKMGTAAKRILATKLSCWSEEYEYRYLGNENRRQEIGNVTAVYIGDPYTNIINAHELQNHSVIREYRCRVEALMRTASAKQIACHQVGVVNGVVQVQNAEEVSQK